MMAAGRSGGGGCGGGAPPRLAALLGALLWAGLGTPAGGQHANDRVVFDRPIGANQGVQFPIARCYAAIEAAGAELDVGGVCAAIIGTAVYWVIKSYFPFKSITELNG